MKRQREAISLCRRDIAKMIETAVGEGIAFGAPIEGCRTWGELHGLYRRIIEGLPRNADLALLEDAASALTRLAACVHKRLEEHVKSIKSSASESQTEQPQTEFKPDEIHEFEPGFRESAWGKVETADKGEGEAEARAPVRLYPLSLVLKACRTSSPLVAGISAIGRSSSAPLSASGRCSASAPAPGRRLSRRSAGLMPASPLPAILQRADSIKSPGAYLRALTAKALDGHFSLGPVLMALLTRTNTAAA